MAALVTAERFGGQANATVLGTGTAASLPDTVQGTGVLVQHSTSPTLGVGPTCLAAKAETASRYGVNQLGSRSATYWREAFMLTANVGTTCFIAELRATTTTVAAQLRINTSNQIDMRDATTAVGSALQLFVNELVVIEWVVLVTGTAQSLRIYKGDKIDSTDTADAALSSVPGAASYTSGTMDYLRYGNIGATAGGVSWVRGEWSVDDAALPAPTFKRIRGQRRSLPSMGI